MVIWRDIYLVDLLEPSTLLLHKPLWKQKKGQNDCDTFPTEPHKKFRFWLHSQDAGGKNEEKKCDFLKTETLTSRWSVELDHKLIESAEDGDLVLALDADSWSRKKAVAKNKWQE